MPERVFIIHGYLSYPEEAWLPWLKAELDRRGYAVSLPAMPHPDHPTIGEWIAFISQLVGEPDRHTTLVGHSMGCQAVLRYLETLGFAGKSVKRTVLVAGGFPPGLSPEEADRRTGGNATLRPWFTLPADAKKIKAAAGRCTVILSDNDPLISLAAAQAGFRATLDPEIIVDPGKGHFNEDDKLTELPSALAAVIR